MKILQVHNYYRNTGGEKSVLDNEANLLKKYGKHDIIRYTKDSSHIKGLINKLHVFLNLKHSNSIFKEFDQVLKKEKPDLVHVHNTFPIITPAIFYALDKTHIPVVYTLHNFRLIYPNALLLNDGKIDERTINKSAYSVVFDKVYQNSFLKTLALAHLIEYHKKHKTWLIRVDQFISLTNFSKNIFVESGIPEKLISIKPNFAFKKIVNRSIEDVSNDKPAFLLFVGRISDEKGIDLIIEAARLLPDINFKIAGDGDLFDKMSKESSKNVEWLGKISKNEVNDYMRKAYALIFPSRWYEGFPMTIVESYSNGLPVISSDIGSQAEIVIDNKTGLHFSSNSSKDLANKIQFLIKRPEVRNNLSNNSRQLYLENYTEQVNYNILMDIYSKAINEKKSKNNSDSD